VWLRMGTGSVVCSSEHGNEPSSSVSGGDFFLLAE
jgi:hypothetical protein